MKFCSSGLSVEETATADNDQYLEIITQHDHFKMILSPTSYFNVMNPDFSNVCPLEVTVICYYKM